MKKFWLVVNVENHQGGLWYVDPDVSSGPFVTKGEAVEGARKLIKERPWKKFFVLEAILGFDSVAHSQEFSLMGPGDNCIENMTV